MKKKKGLSFDLLIIFLVVAAVIGLVFTPVMAQDGGQKEGFPAGQIVTEGEPGPDEEFEESFGENYQYTFIPAADFTPYNSSTTYGYTGFSHYRYLTAGNYMDAGIRLPSGALLSVARLYYYDNDATRDPGLALFRFDTQDNTDVLCLIDAPPGTPGFTSTATGCTSINQTISNGSDVYVMRVVLSGAAGSNLQFKGVRLFWRRQIRTGLPNPFNDIGSLPAEFQNSITALYASGITTGTTSTTYSPFQSVNRAQMAVFLARALGLYWGTPY